MEPLDDPLDLTTRRPDSGSFADQTGESLVLAVAQGNEQAMRVLYQRFGGMVFALATRILGDRTLAEDICQEVFLQLWKNAAEFDPARGRLRTLLMTKTHGKCVDLIRSRNAQADRESRVALDPSKQHSDAIDSELMALNDAEAVRVAVENLPYDERVVLHLAYFGANTYKEVARILSIPEGTAKTRMRSGLKRLRGDLAETVFDDRWAHTASASNTRTSSPAISSPAVATPGPVRS